MLAIIPARKDSKGLKNKNVKKLINKPLICWTIEALLKSKKISSIIVSTDDERVIKICKKYNIEVPFKRPKYLAKDKTPAIDVYKHTLNKLNKINKTKIDEFLVALPTSPLRTYKDINNAIDIFYTKKAESVISCCKVSHPSAWALNIKKNMQINYKKLRDKNNANRQDIKEEYMPNGAIYILKLKNLIKYNSYYTSKSFCYEMEKKYSIDIDDIFDFNLARLILNKNKKYFSIK